MSAHMPAGEFFIIALFLVSQSDAWASLTKAWLRVCGIVLGGGAALVALVSCADKPWVLFPLQALILAVALFLSRTTTAPYACALFGLVFYIVVPEFISVPAASLERGLWIIFSLAVGALFRSEEHTSELQSLRHLVCRLLLEKKKCIGERRQARQGLVAGRLGDEGGVEPPVLDGGSERIVGAGLQLSADVPQRPVKASRNSRHAAGAGAFEGAEALHDRRA